MKRALLVVGALTAVGAVMGARAARTDVAHELPYYQDATLTPHFAIDSAELARAHRVGEFSFVNQRGAAVTQRDVGGRVYVASFFYTECRTLCPDVKAQLARVHAAFAADTGVLILSHSVLPERDDAGRLEHYAHLNAVDGRQWLLLTGDRHELERVARERYFVELADTTGNTRGRLRHTETLVLVDGAGRIRGVYDGSLAFEVSQLISDINVLRRGHV